jgi:hypothetical protein
MRCLAWVFLAGPALLGAGPEMAPAPASAVLLGTVRNESGQGLPGVRAQAFLDGYPLVSTRTDSVGAYRLVFPWIVTADSTVVVWWTAEETKLVPAVAVLRESRAARRLGLWDVAIPRVAAPAESVHDPVLCSRSRVERQSAVADTTGSDVRPESQPEEAPAGN